MPGSRHPEDNAPAPRTAAATIAEAGTDDGWVPHADVRNWLGKLASGDLDASPPTP